MYHPIAHFGVRPDLALELGLLEIARAPISEVAYRSLMAKYGTKKGGLLKRLWPDYRSYKSAVAKYALPREVVLFYQIHQGETAPRAVLSDGHHHFYVPTEGLFESVMFDARRAIETSHPELLALESEDDPLRPRTLDDPAELTVAPGYFVLVADGCRRAAIMPRSMWNDFVASRPFLTILHPNDLDVAKA